MPFSLKPGTISILTLPVFSETVAASSVSEKDGLEVEGGEMIYRVQNRAMSQLVFPPANRVYNQKSPTQCSVSFSADSFTSRQRKKIFLL